MAPIVRFEPSHCAIFGVGKGSLLEKGSFQKVHFLEIQENVEFLEILQSPQTVENKEGSDHFLENLE